MADELHYPPGAEPQTPAPEAPKDEPKPDAAPAPEEPAPEQKPEEKPEEKPDEPAPESPLPKKRSIYDDLKDTRQEKNAFKAVAIAALEAQGVTLTGKETAEELQALAKKTPSQTPPKETPAPSAPADDLEAYAKEHELDANALGRLAEIIAKRIPAAQLSEQDAKELSDLKGWKASKVAEEQRQTEDREVLATAPTVKTQLDIHDEAELKAVMDEIVKLSHTKDFHDKEVDYIVWKNRDALSKLVSPKKPSFESGGQRAEAEPEKEIEFSGKLTPAQAQQATQASYPKSALEIRRQK